MCLACSLASLGLRLAFPCGGKWRWTSGYGSASNKPKLIPLSFDVDFFFHHGPDIQLGKLQLVICPPPALSSHANRPRHTQWHGPSPPATGLRRDVGQRQALLTPGARRVVAPRGSRECREVAGPGTHRGQIQSPRSLGSWGGSPEAGGLALSLPYHALWGAFDLWHV